MKVYSVTCLFIDRLDPCVLGSKILGDGPSDLIGRL